MYTLSNSNAWWGSKADELTGGKFICESADVYPGTYADQMCLWDLHNYLPDDILAKVDRATMAASIEGRDPLIDHRIVEFAFRLPLHLRRGPLGPKHILRRILYQYVPHELIDRPKQGFAIPLFEWLRGDLHHLLDDYLNSTMMKSQGILNSEVASEAIKSFNRGDGNSANKVWSLLAFQLWHEQLQLMG